MSIDSSQFISVSDFPTLKNDNSGDASITVAPSFSIAGSATWESHVDLNIGTQGAIGDARIKISVNAISVGWVATQWVSATSTGISSGLPTQYGMYAFVWRASATVLRCQVAIPNPSSFTLTTDANTTVFDFHVDTFLPPFA